jgi:GAF domain-containing protein
MLDDQKTGVNGGGVGGTPDEMLGWRRETVRFLLRATAILGGLVVLGTAYAEYQRGTPGNILIFIGAYLVHLLLAFWPRVPYAVQVGGLLFVFYGVALFLGISMGLSGGAGVPLLLFTVAATLFLGRRAGLFALILSMVSFVALGLLFMTGQIAISADRLVALNVGFGGWASGAAMLLLSGALLVLSETRLFGRLSETLRRSREVTTELEATRQDLEMRIEERTAALARRARYLESTAAVSRQAAAMMDNPGQMLDEIVNLVSRELGFYHTGLFFVDTAKNWAELVAASSDGGARMLARHHRLRVGEQGMVGYVAASGRHRIALDVGQDAVFFENPDLPETRSEVALPLRVHDQVIGVLDVQSVEPEAFSDEDLSVLQVLADQLAIAISNARLFRQVQESAEAERRAYQELTAEAWRQLLAVEQDLGFISNAEVTMPAGDMWRPEMEAALHEGVVVVDEDGELPAMALPITVRGEVVGVIDGRKAQPGASWTEEEIELARAFADQLEVALEGARLYRDAQTMAVREQLIREITDEMGRAADLSSLMRITAEALNRRLGGSRVYVRLTSDGQNGS